MQKSNRILWLSYPGIVFKKLGKGKI